MNPAYEVGKKQAIAVSSNLRLPSPIKGEGLLTYLPVRKEIKGKVFNSPTAKLWATRTLIFFVTDAWSVRDGDIVR